MDLDTRLRESMRRNADDAPTGASLLDGVHLHRKRFERRRATGVVAAVAAVATGIALVPSLIGGRPEIADRSTLTLAEANLEVPVFPYEITWMPPGSAELKIRYNNGFATAHAMVGETADVLIMVGDAAFPLPSNFVEESDTLVGSHPAKKRVGDPAEPWVMLSWAQDGHWITIRGSGTLREADVRRIGESLRPRPLEIETPIRLRYAPQGWVIGLVETDRDFRRRTLTRGSSIDPWLPADPGPRFSLCLADPATIKDHFVQLCVYVQKDRIPRDALASEPRTVVNGRVGWLRGDNIETGPTVYFETDDWAVSVSPGAGPRLSERDLVRFAEGISIVEP